MVAISKAKKTIIVDVDDSERVRPSTNTIMGPRNQTMDEVRQR